MGVISELQDLWTPVSLQEVINIIKYYKVL